MPFHVRLAASMLAAAVVGGEPSIRLEIVLPDANDKGGSVLYGHRSGKCQSWGATSLAAPVPNDRPREFVSKFREATADGSGGEYVMTSQGAIVGDDASEPAISATSILAKVTRDRILVEFEARWPGYGFAQHKGYPAAAHVAALRRLDPCPEHRRSFAPVREACLRLG